MVLNHCADERTRDERGIALVLGAISMVFIIVLLAFVIDLGYMRQRAREEQGSVDSAALAGAADIPTGTTADATASLAGRDSAFAYVKNNLGITTGWSSPSCAANLCTYTHATQNRVLLIETPCTTRCTAAGVPIASGASASNYIYVRDCADVPGFFRQVFSTGTGRVCRQSVARHLQTRESSGIGMISLHPTASCAINVNGTNDITIDAGAVIANSTNTSPGAICGTGGSSPWFIDTQVISTAGSVDPDVYSHTNGDILTGQAVIADPFAALPTTPCLTNSTAGIAAAVAACSGSSPLRPTAIGTCATAMTPGYFASGCSINGNNPPIDMLPGVYWFNGSFDPGNHNLICSTCNANQGVLMYFYAGSLSHTGNGTVNLFPYSTSQPGGTATNPPTALAYGGMSVYQRRGNTTEMNLGGTTGQNMGSIYAPDAMINMHGTPNRTIDGIVVGAYFDFNGTSNIVIDPPSNAPHLPPVVELALSA